MKINTFLLILFTMSLTVHGQTKQGVLIRTTLGPFLGWYGSHAGRQSIKVGINNVSKGSNTGSESKIEYDFFYVTDNPSIIECSGSTAGNYDNTDCGPLTETIAYNKETFDSNSFGGCIADSDIMGIYLPQPIETTICEKKSINLTRGWNWQYSYDGSNWVNFPSQFQQKRNISFKLTDLNGYNGKTKLLIHTGYQNQFTDFIIYDIIPCSPDLVGEPVVTQPTCFYNKDGKVTFTFDRDLITRERLDLKLIQIVNGNDLPAIEKTLTQSDFPDRKATYDGLGSGAYYLHYQTFQDNGSTATSDNRSPQFVISAPSAFSYELKDTDVSCNNGSDGTIEIKILTGVGPYEFYQDGVKVTPEFVMGKYYIKGLEAKEGGYKIKVTGNGCIEK